MNRIPKLLSKTKLMRGFRCVKSIYLTIHEKQLEPPVTPELQALFDQGNRVGEEARLHFPGGVLVDNKPWDFVGSIKHTQHLIEMGAKIIYEAAFEYKGFYARADIIVFNPETERWNIYEVKSSTKVKPEQIDDVGLQTWIMAKSGLKLENIHIMHLNSECRYPDLDELFVKADVTQEMRDNYLNVLPTLKEIMDVIQQPDPPAVDIGPQCIWPNECPFKNHCWEEKKIPELSVFNLPSIRDKKWELYEEGIVELTDSRLTDLSDIQQRVIDCYKSGERFIDINGIEAAMQAWQFPLIFLDFETIGPAIPTFVGCRPFQQVPFQYSVHYWASPDAPLEHTEFLHQDESDPRPAIIPALLKDCRREGSIVAYYGAFESARIKELADFSPADADALLTLNERIVDPLPIIRENVYDNQFMGSFSLKKVAPALLGAEQSYKGMTVEDGGAAQRAYAEMVSPHTPKIKKEALKQGLLEYCKKDTLVMVDLAKWLYNPTH